MNAESWSRWLKEIVMSNSKLSIKGLAMAASVLWGASVFVVGSINLIAPSYGLSFLWFASSVYPGYKAEPSFVSVLIGTAYALLDGLITGALFAWLYNLCSAMGKK